LRQLPQQNHPQLIVGIDTADDAGVYRLDNETALIQTVDFFTPIVDDPYLFGQIAAANSLSDVYAMGGKPLTVMNIIAFPVCSLDSDVLLAILQGGQSKIAEAGAVLVGGHTVNDTEPKYGLSVTGTVHPDKVWTNAGARVGDYLLLTKPLGTGILASAARAEMFPTGVEAATQSMATLNRQAAELVTNFNISACTDITGFGLLGHLYEMASASKVEIEIRANAVPLLPDAAEAAQMGLIPGGAYANRDYLTKVSFAEAVPEWLRDICFDPQTSGGLLFSLPQAEADKALAAMQAAGITQAAIIGKVVSQGEGEIYVY
jgi:selenide,water dikinase